MKELTKGSPVKLILMFTMPLLVGNLFQQLYSISDTLIVGQTLGVNELAAVGATGSIQFLIIGFAQGLTAGLSIMTAQYFGAHDYRKVRVSFAASIVICIGATLILTFLSLFFINDILNLMQTPAAIKQDAQLFISIIFAGIFASMAFNLLANIIRALGDSRTPLYFLIVAAVFNVILELIFILVFHMGVEGAGFATVIAQIFSVVLCILYIIKKMPLLQVRRSDFKKITAQELRRHLYVGLPMAFQTSIIAIGSIMIQAALNGLGTTAVAATTAASKIDQVAIQPMMSFGIAMATFTAQNFGAHKYDRILKGVKQSLLVSGTFSIVAGLLIILFGRNLVVLFVGKSEEKVLNLSQIYFNVNGSFYLMLATLFILRYTLQGLGESVIPTLAGIVELLMRCIAALLLATSVGYVGTCFANPLAWLGSCLVLIISYLKAMKMLKQKQGDIQLDETVAAQQIELRQ
ncbi:MATE family efflux transporter [Liquorilactobacillus capillatus]|uniref:Probable multidrug resistance protein NorM n=1 Tax=Liquorilactobacillus capillatus DSM 19910 TaxID=1423731 RepID=A0A0R1MBG7_9LACO|nr:MATE family efflux transporter [Liquorilactobacillus capillatus]KRL03172.1 MATE efflux family protein [Liquorilactobacillus capillatus DSM 19910]